MRGSDVIDTYSVNSMLCVVLLTGMSIYVITAPFVGLALYVLMYSRNILEDQGL